MGVSPSHQFGQIIGETLESAISPILDNFAKYQGLYLDKKGKRPCRTGKKCTWVDLYKNSHDLDFVLERGGSSTKLGMPAAFIEVAWRRYTKHSRNKAQEIQGAILPLAETYRHLSPFKGAILAGEFTKGALDQLTSLGFSVLYIPLKSIVGAFKKLGIDAYFDEDTPDREFSAKIRMYQSLTESKRFEIARDLLNAHKPEVQKFISDLELHVSRQIKTIRILPLYGNIKEMKTIDEAVQFILNHQELKDGIFQKFEIQVAYNNGNKIDAIFIDKQSAVEFLRSYQPVSS